MVRAVWFGIDAPLITGAGTTALSWLVQPALCLHCGSFSSPLWQLSSKIQTWPIPLISHGHSWRVCGVLCAAWAHKLWTGISPISGTHDLMRVIGERDSTAWVWQELWGGTPQLGIKQELPRGSTLRQCKQEHGSSKVVGTRS